MSDQQGGVVASVDLEAEARDSFPELDGVYLRATGDAGTRVLYARVRQGVADTALANRIAAHFYARGHLVLPALFSGDEWKRLPAGAELAALDSARLLCRELEALGSQEGGAAKARNLLRARLDGLGERLGELRTTARLPRHLALDLAAGLLHEAFVLLSAAHGRAFQATPEDWVWLGALLAADGRLVADDLLAYCEIAGAAAKERALFGARPVPDLEVEERVPADRIASFLERCAMHVEARYPVSPEQLRRRRNLLWMGGAVVVCGTALALVVGTYKGSLTPADPALIRAPGGIIGEYFKGKAFETKVLERTDARIDFKGSGGIIVPEAGERDYSARWSGFLYFASAGTHQVCVERDDGARVYLGSKLVLDGWTVSSRLEECAQARVQQGWYPLRVDYFQDGGDATIRLLTVQNGERRVVESKDLCCTTR